MNPDTEKEICEIIIKVSARNPLGPNSIPNGILKDYKHILEIPITIIINISLISLLSNTSKIIDKTMYSRLYKFLDKYNCLYKKQFGFRNSHSTNHALASIKEEIKKA